MFENFSDALSFLERYIPSPSQKHPGKLGLLRMKLFLRLLGNPHLHYPVVQIGGTAGKGSTATILASCLATKYKVGLYTSPHLVKITERIKILAPENHFSTPQEREEKSILSEENFMALLAQLRPYLERLAKEKYGPPTYFEILTAMAFWHFLREKVEIAVVEVGLGGRFDATNVVKPLATVITNVGLDHTEVLGKTVEKIARDKAGIIKKGSFFVTGAQQPSVFFLFKKKCQKEKVPLFSFGGILPPKKRKEEIFLKKWRGEREKNKSAHSSFFSRIRKIGSQKTSFAYYGKKFYPKLELSLLGRHQIINASLALKVLEELKNFPLGEKEIKKGLLRAFIPGRLEIVSRRPLTIFDGAHNPDKVRALTVALPEIFPRKKIITLLAIKKGKDFQRMLPPLIALSQKIIFTHFSLSGDLGLTSSYDPRQLYQAGQKILRPWKKKGKEPKSEKIFLWEEKIPQALQKVRSLAGGNDLILVTGSLYLIGEVKKIFPPENW